MEGETLTLELANGKTFVLSDAWYAADGNAQTEEGNLQILFPQCAARARAHVSEPLVIKLSRPIEAHGEQITELRIDEITAGMLTGIKVHVDQDGCLVLDLACIARFLSNAASIPPSATEGISVRDLIGTLEELQDFFEAHLQTGGDADLFRGVPPDWGPGA